MPERIPHLEDYPTSRASLLTEATDHGAALSSYTHPLRGPDGEDLATDVARFGAPVGEAKAVVVLASGTHGVEGHGGWGVQQLVVSSGRLDRLPAGLAVLVVHAVNPYGMAWSRRVDHNNVDVNRNFLNFDNPLPTNSNYDDFDGLLNPATPDFDPDDATWLDDFWVKFAEMGKSESFRAVSGGQYHMPAGVQFGGQAPTWSNKTLNNIWQQHLEDAAIVINLDIHTGLGNCGALTLFQSANEPDAAAAFAAESFPNVARFDRPETAEPLTVGVLGPGMEAALSAPELVMPLVVEFGTHDTSRVLKSMRADNWLHQHGTPRSALGEQIRADTRDAFFVDDEAWREQVADQGLATVDAAIDAARQAR